MMGADGRSKSNCPVPRDWSVDAKASGSATLKMGNTPFTMAALQRHCIYVGYHLVFRQIQGGRFGSQISVPTINFKIQNTCALFIMFMVVAGCDNRAEGWLFYSKYPMWLF